jgi:uncharacterized FAD-dependent dehydrogenase
MNLGQGTRMIRIAELKLPLEAANAPDAALRAAAAQALGIAEGEIGQLAVFKRSFDARKAQITAVYIVDVSLRAGEAAERELLARHTGNPHIRATPDMRWHPPAQAPQGLAERPVVVGFGPCGMFAALCLAQMGFRPIVLERGKPVRERTQDTWALWRKRKLSPQSNVQFGEGGAGTFSDGKLYSQIKDPRFLGRKVIDEFVKAGAPEDIRYAAHPHIGTFKLVKVVEHIRAQIVALGGELRFHSQVVGLLRDAEGLRGLRVRDLASGADSECPTRHAVLALGHSARDSFAMLHDAGLEMQAKPFSVGVRIEHPQSVIDRARWGRHAGHPLLGAADYKLVHHAANGRAVYSFCMCPGGTVVAATSEPGRVVTNGMSQYSRNERNANAGLVVAVEPADFPLDLGAWQAAFGNEDGARYAAEAAALGAGQPARVHPLAGIVFQRALESRAFDAGGGNYDAPAQRVEDFLAARPSQAIGAVQPSYRPGVRPGDLAEVLPGYAVQAMREALPVFGRQIAGYDMPDALMTAVETRTSSPLRIARGAADFQSPSLRGLYPAGEGAGYAGGILSAGVDGIRVAEAVGVSMARAPAR